MIDLFLKKYKSVFSPSYYAMDSGYDFEYVYVDIINKYNTIPLIDYTPRGSFAPLEVLDKDFYPIYSAGYKFVYWGKDKTYLKFRCPHYIGKCDCPLRSSDEWEKQYDKRTSVKRCNSRLKRYLNLENIRFKGIKKAKIHALLNCITLIAGTIAVNSRKSLNTAA